MAGANRVECRVEGAQGAVHHPRRLVRRRADPDAAHQRRVVAGVAAGEFEEDRVARLQPSPPPRHVRQPAARARRDQGLHRHGLGPGGRRGRQHGGGDGVLVGARRAGIEPRGEPGLRVPGSGPDRLQLGRRLHRPQGGQEAGAVGQRAAAEGSVDPSRERRRDEPAVPLQGRPGEPAPAHEGRQGLDRVGAVRIGLDVVEPRVGGRARQFELPDEERRVALHRHEEGLEGEVARGLAAGQPVDRLRAGHHQGVVAGRRDGGPGRPCRAANSASGKAASRPRRSVNSCIAPPSSQTALRLRSGVG